MEPLVPLAQRAQPVPEDRLEPQVPPAQPELTEPQVRRVLKASRVQKAHKVASVLALCSKARSLTLPLCQLRPLRASPISLIAPARCGSTTQLIPGSMAVLFKAPKASKVSKAPLEPPDLKVKQGPLELLARLVPKVFRVLSEPLVLPVPREPRVLRATRELSVPKAQLAPKVLRAAKAWLVLRDPLDSKAPLEPRVPLALLALKAIVESKV